MARRKGTPDRKPFAIHSSRSGPDNFRLAREKWASPGQKYRRAWIRYSPASDKARNLSPASSRESGSLHRRLPSASQRAGRAGPRECGFRFHLPNRDRNKQRQPTFRRKEKLNQSLTARTPTRAGPFAYRGSDNRNL